MRLRLCILKILVGVVGVGGLVETTLSTSSLAGVFNIPHLVSPGEFAIGIEPEVLLSGAGSLGLNLRYTQGISDMSNLVGIIGTGGGPRQFRFGGAYTFDFFPDLENQPGIGLAVQGLFVQTQTAGSYEFTGVPYVHKSFKTTLGEIEPFLGIPVGIALSSSGTYQGIVNLALGSLYKHNENLRIVVEIGIGMANVSSTISGGVVYYH